VARLSRNLAGAFAITLLCAASAAAVEMATDAERSYRELRKSTDVATQLLGDRWRGLVRLQEWTDATGKFNTRAKYVEHDPGLQWVKLRVIRGTGDERVVKDIEVPVERLNPMGQSRVRQIAFLSGKVAEALVAEREREAENDGGAGGDGRLAADRDPRGGLDVGEEAALGRGGPAEEFVRGAPQDRDSRAFDPRAGRTTPLVTNSGPLPAVLPLVPSIGVSSGTASEVDGATPVERSAPEQSVSAADLPDDAPWRTDYEAFRGNFSVIYERAGNHQVNWGDLQSLSALYYRERDRVAVERSGRAGPLPPEQIASDFASLGEFVWETTIASDPAANDWTAALGLPPLPEPVKLQAELDEQKGAGDWQRLKVGDRAEFVGRFVRFEPNYGIVIAIRFPELPSSDEGQPTYPR
jgi:hypothetical protein